MTVHSCDQCYICDSLPSGQTLVMLNLRRTIIKRTTKHNKRKINMKRKETFQNFLQLQEKKRERKKKHFTSIQAWWSRFIYNLQSLKWVRAKSAHDSMHVHVLSAYIPSKDGLWPHSLVVTAFTILADIHSRPGANMDKHKGSREFISRLFSFSTWTDNTAGEP